MLLNSENFNLWYQWCKFQGAALLKVSFLLQEAMTAGAGGSQGPVPAAEGDSNYLELALESSRVEK